MSELLDELPRHLQRTNVFLSLLFPLLPSHFQLSIHWHISRMLIYVCVYWISVYM